MTISSNYCFNYLLPEHRPGTGKCKKIFHVNGVPGLVRVRWMSHQLELNLPAANPTGIRGDPQEGAQPRRHVLASRSQPHCRDPRGGRHQARGGWGWTVCWARLGSSFQAEPSHDRAAACSLLSRHTLVCRCWCWHCRSHPRAASARQEHADLPYVSPRQAPRCQRAALSTAGCVAPTPEAGSAP